MKTGSDADVVDSASLPGYMSNEASKATLLRKSLSAVMFASEALTTSLGFGMVKSGHVSGMPMRLPNSEQS